MAGNLFTRLKRPRPRHLAVLNGQDFKQAILAGQAWLDQHKAAVNQLNVFPVPDGDTGTNMSLTLRAATKEIAQAAETSAAVIAEKLSRGALMGARGNSGVILSQILRGFSNGLGKKDTFTAADFAAALQEAARMAYQAVIKPVEGTILTVVREAAEAAQASAARGADITTMLGDTVFAARAAVAKTPDMLPILKQAGVVDAGGQGLTYIIEGIWRFSRGESVEPSRREREADVEVRKGDVEIEEEFGYEVVFLVSGEHLDVARIRDTITAMGGVSTVVAGDATLLKVHTHTATPGRILDYGVSLGSLRDINIENLQEQSLRYAAESRRERDAANGTAGANGARAANGHGGASAPPPAGAQGIGGANGRAGTALATPPAVREAAPAAQEAAPALGVHEIATVAVVAGAGWEEVFRSLNVSTIVPGGQTMNPSTEELLAAVESCPSDKVILLPNNGNVIMSARQVPHLTRKQVHVIPSDSMPQGISALLAFNFEADFEENRRAMEDAIKRVDTVEITQAVRAVQLEGINVREGDIIGLVNGRLVTAGTDMLEVAQRALARMGAGRHELFTVYHGEGVDRAAAEALALRIKGWFPSIEIEVVDGGQPFYAYIISAE